MAFANTCQVANPQRLSLFNVASAPQRSTMGLERIVSALSVPLFGKCVVVERDHPEMEGIYRLRYQVYIKELKKNLPWADHERRHLVDPEDRNGVHFAVTRFGRVVGCARVHFGAEIAQEILAVSALADFERQDGHRGDYVSRLMIARSIRGKGAAFAIMLKMIQCAVARGHDHAVFHCNAKLVSFYQRLGFRICGAPFETAHSGVQTPMAVIWGDSEHLTAIGSPLARPLRCYRLHAGRVHELRAALFDHAPQTLGMAS
jgi:predicted GNAT family N-acyltransferase